MVLFHMFSSQDERREFGGSYFIEIQYCVLARGTKMEKIISVDAPHWKGDSLYVYGDDEEAFVSQYGEVFPDGTYCNGERGIMDTCGLNYYTPGQVHSIVERIEKAKPLDYQILLDWLKRADAYNGIYVMGL